MDVLHVSPEIRQQVLADSINLGATQVPPSANLDQVPAIQNAINLAFVFAFRMLMRVCIALSILSALVASRWIKTGESVALSNPPG
jgi:hypothetical protein